ncbi:MAG: SAM-dependent methyltransferase [Planctomycetota bacterium]|nr:MAG: SAM-dependent methyltransferase [Planctomycetota bacterium]
MKRVLEPEVMDTDEEADGYDSMDHSGPNQSFVERLVALGAAGRMLDIGCGPGHIPLLVCESIDQAEVLGIDLAEKMLRHARRHAGESPFGERCSFQLGDAKGLDFADHSFDCVYSNTILHHIPDPLPFLQEAWRVLRPGGVFLVRDLFRPDSIENVESLVATYAAKESENARALFHASLCAALRVEELRELSVKVSPELEVAVDSDRHMSLQGRKPELT